jgi:hypothetical protein
LQLNEQLEQIEYNKVNIDSRKQGIEPQQTRNLQAGYRATVDKFKNLLAGYKSSYDKFYIKIKCNFYTKTSYQILDSQKPAKGEIHVQKLTFISPFIVTKIKCTYQTIQNQNENIVVK